MKIREIHFFPHAKDRYLLKPELQHASNKRSSSMGLPRRNTKSRNKIREIQIRGKRRAPQKTWEEKNQAG